MKKKHLKAYRVYFKPLRVLASDEKDAKHKALKTRMLLSVEDVWEEKNPTDIMYEDVIA